MVTILTALRQSNPDSSRVNYNSNLLTVMASQLPILLLTIIHEEQQRSPGISIGLAAAWCAVPITYPFGQQKNQDHWGETIWQPWQCTWSGESFFSEKLHDAWHHNQSWDNRRLTAIQTTASLRQHKHMIRPQSLLRLVILTLVIYKWMHIVVIRYV